MASHSTTTITASSVAIVVDNILPATVVIPEGPPPAPAQGNQLKTVLPIDPLIGIVREVSLPNNATVADLKTGLNATAPFRRRDKVTGALTFKTPIVSVIKGPINNNNPLHVPHQQPLTPGTVIPFATLPPPANSDVNISLNTLLKHNQRKLAATVPLASVIDVAEDVLVVMWQRDTTAVKVLSVTVKGGLMLITWLIGLGVL